MKGKKMYKVIGWYRYETCTTVRQVCKNILIKYNKSDKKAIYIQKISECLFF